MSVDRRTIILGLAALGGISWTLRPRADRALRLRPPGARAPDTFEALCIRCFRCAEVCPAGCIRFDATADVRQLGTPYLAPKDRGCTLCMACTEACPTGALVPTSPEPARVAREVRMGVPVLDKHKCLSWTNKGVCRACYYACPYADTAITLANPLQGPVFHREACVGCALCSEACPDQAKAIDIRVLRDA